jgi:S-methylmethionine-dependent homocysteine/selenocysteine methylase
MSSLPDILLLDGPTGTELQRRGIDTTLPLWSARALLTAPEVVEQIHLDYIAAGADVVTTNSFRTNRRAIERSGLAGEAERLTRLSVEIARRAIERSGRTGIVIGGSDAPVEDCYAPDLVPSNEELHAEHEEHIRWLVEAGCDLVLIETMNTLREAAIASEAASTLGSPFMISVVADMNGENILIGEPIYDAVQQLHEFGPQGILVNCSSPQSVLRGVEIIAQVHDDLGAAWRFGGYANSGEPDPVVGWNAVKTVPVVHFCIAVQQMIALGATVIGSCCGTTPAYTQELSLLKNALASSTK